ncbi:MAG: hypothetical protein WA857_21835 [Candidatus Acidiferrum sp.]
MPTQLNVTIALNVSGTLTNSTVVVPISSGLQALDSGASSGQGQASGQSGFSSVDEAVRNLFRAGVFLASNNIWYPVWVVQSVTWS